MTSIAASRFFQRWINADPSRAENVANFAQSPLSPGIFTAILQKETSSRLPLPRAIRRLRNLIVAVLMERDLNGLADLAEVVSTMTAFAEFAVQTHVADISAEMCAIHGEPIGKESGAIQQLIVLGMGKLGGGELNVSSDIDLIFCYPEDGDTLTTSPEQRSLSNHEFFIRLGKKLIGALSEITEDGFTFRVDMALRPNGQSGPLVTSFGMLEEYLIVQGREWERYAWIKARALTGRSEDIAQLENIVQPFVFRRYLDFGAIEAMRAMHAQIRAEVARQEARHPDRKHNVKLGRGGIREIEFLVQVFQLIRGGRDMALRERSTRAALRILADKQLLSADVAEQLLQAYTFLRNLEHRLQYLDDAQTHTMPVNEADQLTIAQMMGYADTATLLAELDRWRTFAAAHFDAIFSESDIASASEACATLSDRDTIEAHLIQLGMGGMNNTPEITQQITQRLLATWQAPRLQSLPETSRNKLAMLIHAALAYIATIAGKQFATLGRLLDFLEAIARRAAYLSLLIEYPHTLERVIRMMHASNWAAQYLTLHPILLDELLDDSTLTTIPDWNAFLLDCQRELDNVQDDTERQLDILREMHHAQLFRLLAQDLEGKLTVEHLADHLSALADALIAATIHAIWQTITNRHRDTPKFAVIAYGKLGGKELGYASDLDIIFLYDDDDQDAPPIYAKLAQRLITWMTSHTSAGILFDIDTALRPDGASGLLVSSITSFEKYQNTSAWTWEHQALTRARFCAGDAETGARFEAIRERILRQPRDTEKLKQDVLAMRQRMHQAHPNRTTLFDLKNDAGGMIDIEFIVQFLVLNHAARYPQLTHDIGNIALLKLCGELGLIEQSLANDVANAYRAYRKLQHQIRLQGEENARVDTQRVASEIACVKRLWGTCF